MGKQLIRDAAGGRAILIYSRSLIAFGLTDGGTAGLIYSFIICLLGFFCVYFSLAEMASMAPSSGGQYREQRISNDSTMYLDVED